MPSCGGDKLDKHISVLMADSYPDNSWWACAMVYLMCINCYTFLVVRTVLHSMGGLTFITKVIFGELDLTCWRKTKELDNSGMQTFSKCPLSTPWELQ